MGDEPFGMMGFHHPVGEESVFDAELDKGTSLPRDNMDIRSLQLDGPIEKLLCNCLNGLQFVSPPVFSMICYFDKKSMNPSADEKIVVFFGKVRVSNMLSLVTTFIFFIFVNFCKLMDFIPSNHIPCQQ